MSKAVYRRCYDHMYSHKPISNELAHSMGEHQDNAGRTEDNCKGTPTRKRIDRSGAGTGSIRALKRYWPPILIIQIVPAQLSFL